MSISGRAAHSLRSWPFADDGFGLRSIEHEGGYGSRPSAGRTAREALAAAEVVLSVVLDRIQKGVG